MNTTMFLGYIITAVITLGSFIGVIQKFTQPLNDLKIVIQELKLCIENLKKDNDLVNRRLTIHGNEIEELKLALQRIETKMNMYHHE